MDKIRMNIDTFEIVHSGHFLVRISIAMKKVTLNTIQNRIKNTIFIDY